MRKPGVGGGAQPRGPNEPSDAEPEGERAAIDHGEFRLAVGDLIAGEAGEVVLFNDSAVREVVLESAEAPIDSGGVDTYVTSDGIDVSGFRYLRFSQGLTLFHNPDTRVRVETPGGDAERGEP